MTRRSTKTAEEVTETPEAAPEKKAVMSTADMLKAQLAAITGKIAAPSGNAIKIASTGSEFDVPGLGTVPAPLKVVVVAFVNRNDFYEGPFDPSNYAPPSCYAIGEEINTMGPGDDVTEPESDTCKVCPMNQFGTALTGKGKACKNQILLAVLPLGEPESDILTVKVSPNGLKSVNGMVGVLSARYQMVPIQVVTELTAVPAGASNAFNVNLALEDGHPVLNDDVGGYLARYDEAMAIITAKPDLTPKDNKPARRRPVRR